jgi:hypothetical protein
VVSFLLYGNKKVQHGDKTKLSNLLASSQLYSRLVTCLITGQKKKYVQRLLFVAWRDAKNHQWVEITCDTASGMEHLQNPTARVPHSLSAVSRLFAARATYIQLYSAESTDIMAVKLYLQSHSRSAQVQPRGDF